MIRSLIPSAVAFAWLALAAFPFPVRAELKPDELYAAVLPSVLTLDVENVAGKHFVGSAFVVAGQGVAVTAWHVVHDARHVEAGYADHQRVKVVGLVDKNESLDLALIKLEGAARPRVALGATAPRIGSRIYVIGSPRGFDFSISEGLISQVRTIDGVRYYQLSCPISPGDSGGPVLNDRGEVIGVVSWRKADAENVAFAVPSTALATMASAQPPVAWLATPPGHLSAEGQPDPQPLVRAESPAPAPTNNLHDLQQFLSGLAGQRIGITVQAHGAARHFEIELPPEAAK